MYRCFFSVIIPCYNAIKWIDKALNSLEQQTFGDFEVLIVDDCSSDGTYEYLNDYTLTSKLAIKLLKNERNSGPGTSRNRALKEAKGQYVAFLDSDDWYESSFLEDIYLALKRIEADIVFFDFYRNWENGKEIVMSWTSIFNTNSTQKDYMALCYDSLWVMAVKRSLFMELNLPDLYNAEDTAMVPLLVDKATDIISIHKSLYHYLCRKESLSTSAHEKVYKSFYAAYSFLKEHVSDEYMDEIVFRGVKMIMYGVVYNAIRAHVPIGEFEFILREFEISNPNYRSNLYMKFLPMRKRFFIKCVEKRRYWILSLYCKLQEFLLRIN